MWTCPAAGLWQFTFSICYEAYTGYPSWNLYQNDTHVALIEQASNGVQYITSLGLFITAAKARDTIQWQFQYVSDSSPPVLVSGVGKLDDRSGEWTNELPATEVVPGDVIILRARDIVPADCFILLGALKIDTSSLTGETYLFHSGPSSQILASGLGMSPGHLKGE